MDPIPIILANIGHKQFNIVFINGSFINSYNFLSLGQRHLYIENHLYFELAFFFKKEMRN